jgi:electron transport complex protein RnfD
VDALSGATRLDDVKIQLSLGKMMSELNPHSSAQAWINAGFLLGGLYLLANSIEFLHHLIALHRSVRPPCWN